jgi:hypothetical protein
VVRIEIANHAAVGAEAGEGSGSGAPSLGGSGLDRNAGAIADAATRSALHATERSDRCASHKWVFVAKVRFEAVGPMVAMRRADRNPSRPRTSTNASTARARFSESIEVSS